MSEEQKAYLDGLRKAADMTRDAWNDSSTMVNQRAQAIRCADAIERYAKDCERNIEALKTMVNANCCDSHGQGAPVQEPCKNASDKA